MSRQPIRVGVIDSGVSGQVAAQVGKGRSFVGSDNLDDAIGHGTRICTLIAEQAVDVSLVVAKVFDRRPTTQPARIAEALDWLIAQDVALINMSFGLTADRQVLAASCTRAAAAGIVLVASAPAQGTPCFPAAYPQVIAVTGDARCSRGALSHLDTVAKFGTWCASPEQDTTAIIAGASIAAAHFSGLAAAWLQGHPNATRQDVLAHFVRKASFHGPERRPVNAPT